MYNYYVYKTTHSATLYIEWILRLLSAERYRKVFFYYLLLALIHISSSELLLNLDVSHKRITDISMVGYSSFELILPFANSIRAE